MTSDRQGGRRGGGEGGREFSLPASRVELPGLTSADDGQGGARGVAMSRSKLADAGVSTPSGSPPSLPDATGGKPGRRSQHVKETEPIEVHLPAHLPDLKIGASRALLAILKELTHVEILDTLPEDDPDVDDI
jgi:hypothetical protein